MAGPQLPRRSSRRISTSLGHLALASAALTVLSAAAAGAPDRPIAQDVARMERRRSDRLEWYRRTLGGAYETVGKKDPRWDDLAGKAMDLAARMFSEEVDPEVSFADVNEAASAAIDAGCDDPLLVYLANRSSVGSSFTGEEAASRRLDASARALAASRYPAFRRAIAHQIAGTYALSAETPGPSSRLEAGRNFDAAVALLPESVASDERVESWEREWRNTLDQLIKGYRKLGIGAVPAYERVDAKLAKLPEMRLVRLQLRGYFWYMYGWEARTNAFAVSVPWGGFAKLEDRVAVARKALEEAYLLRPDDVFAPNYLIAIEKTVGGDRAMMELWFDRAMYADGDRSSACSSKLDWLDPKWHGTAEEMVAFGRACRDTKNWRAGITLLACDAHYRYSTRLGRTERWEYMRRPDVWLDIRSVFNEYLKHRPHDDVARSKFAAYSCLGGHYGVAFAQFQKLGDRLTSWADYPNIPLATLKEMRDYTVSVIASTPRGREAVKKLNFPVSPVKPVRGPVAAWRAFVTALPRIDFAAILTAVLLSLAIAILPVWPHSREWGRYPSGGVGLVAVILLILVLTGRL